MIGGDIADISLSSYPWVSCGEELWNTRRTVDNVDLDRQIYHHEMRETHPSRQSGALMQILVFDHLKNYKIYQMKDSPLPVQAGISRAAFKL